MSMQASYLLRCPYFRVRGIRGIREGQRTKPCSISPNNSHTQPDSHNIIVGNKVIRYKHILKPTVPFPQTPPTYSRSHNVIVENKKVIVYGIISPNNKCKQLHTYSKRDSDIYSGDKTEGQRYMYKGNCIISLNNKTAIYRILLYMEK